MKIQKTTTVEVCDKCGLEGRTITTCRLCGKEVCEGCTAIIHAHVDINVPGMYGSMHGWSTNRIASSINGRFCASCQVDVVKKLRDMGMAESDGKF